MKKIIIIALMVILPLSISAQNKTSEKAASSIIYLDSSNDFSNQISKGVVLVDFFATWCGPCKTMNPILEQFSKELPQVKVVKIDVDKHKPLAREYKIKAIPTLFLFKDGKKVWEYTGVVESDELKKVVGKY